MLGQILLFPHIYLYSRHPICPSFPCRVLVLCILKSYVPVSHKIWIRMPNVLGFLRPQKHDTSDSANILTSPQWAVIYRSRTAINNPLTGRRGVLI